MKAKIRKPGTRHLTAALTRSRPLARLDGPSTARIPSAVSQTPEVSPERRGGEAPCVTRFELAGLLQVSLRTVDRMIAAEEINVHRVRGKAVRFLRSDVEEYLGEKRKAESACRTGL